jgi:hypothetical protein
MSFQQRQRVIGRRLRSVAITGALLAIAAAAPSAALAQGTPDQVIDAKANPDAAAAALNSGTCVPKGDGSNCWKNNTTFNPKTNGKPVYGAPSILGDVQYNCSTDEYSETAVGVKDERQESTSISEKVSLKVSLSFIGLAKSSAEFEAFSKQSNSVSTSAEVTNAVAIPPGYRGWTVTRALTGTVTGSAYVTQGINLIQVSNIDLSFPGFRDPKDTSDDPILYTGIKAPMDADDIKAACTNLDENIDTDQLLRTAQARASEFKLGLCRDSGRCTSRKVTGSLPPDVRRASARLTRAGRTYGSGSYLRGQTKLDMRRSLNAGRYKLTLRERPAASELGPGRLSAIKTIVPLTVG